MSLLGVSVFLGCLPFVAQAANDPASFPWSLVAPGTSAGAIIAVVYLMLKKIEKSETFFSDTIAKTQASSTSVMSEISRSTQENLREIRDSIRELSASINGKKE